MPASPERPKLVHFDAIFNPLRSFPARQASSEIHIILLYILTEKPELIFGATGGRVKFLSDV